MWLYLCGGIILFLILYFLAWAWEEPAGGIVAIVIGIVYFWTGWAHTFGIIAGAVGVACYIHAKESKEKANEVSHLHCTVSSTGSYSSILNKCEQIVELIAKRCPWITIHVLVMVEKINSSVCHVTFQITNVTFKNYNITFGSEFHGTDDDCMTYKSSQATGFTTPEDVKRELLCQFNWYNISTNITELKVMDYGDFTHTPMVILRFEAKYKE